MLGSIEQKSGDPHHLDGRLTVYATVEMDQSDLLVSKHPIAQMISNGFLVAQGNFRDQHSLKDFMKSEMGLSLQDGLGELIEKLSGFESALDPQKLKEKIDSFDEIEDIIPTPAKIVSFSSQNEILAQPGDVYDAGTFKNISNANLAINAFPILYQARFREQQLVRIHDEIEALISQVEHSGDTVDAGSYALLTRVELLEKILKVFIPSMLYNKENTEALAVAEGQFRAFTKGYRLTDDIDAIVGIIKKKTSLFGNDYRLLELYAAKIAATHANDRDVADAFAQEIQTLERQ